MSNNLSERIELALEVQKQKRKSRLERGNQTEPLGKLILVLFPWHK